MKRIIAWVLAGFCLLATAGAAEKFTLKSSSDVSKRVATVEDDGNVAYLYLLNAAGSAVEGEAIAYSRVPPSPKSWMMLTLENQSSPLLSAENASERAIIPDAQKSELALDWSADGNAVVLLRGTEPLAFVSGTDKKGRSKAIGKATPMTDPWDEALYVKLFQPESRDTQLRRAIALHDHGDYSGARTIYDKLLVSNPTDTTVLYEAG